MAESPSKHKAEKLGTTEEWVLITQAEFHSRT